MKTASKNIKSDTPNFIVGMGGSAGGLEAFEEFLRTVPADTGVGFVIIAHLDPAPKHKGVMVEILQRATKMPVCQASHGQKVKANSVYIIPPNCDISIMNGNLQLLEPSAPRGLRMPIDFFLRRLAIDQCEKAISLILSGMGTDGTLGLRAIKENLGMTMVQEPKTAKYDGMPRSAIDTNLVDYVAPVAQLAQKLTLYVRHSIQLVSPPTSADKTSAAMQKIFTLLRDHTGHDFSCYKRNTLIRRIERRMTLHQISRLQQYVRFLQDHPGEIDLLFQEMLIGVTNFFRDPEAYEVLESKALANLMKSKNRNNPMRVWCAGCSTGEEAYSLAIILRECVEKAKVKNSFKIQIFATDIDKYAIDKARLGVYPSNIAADVSPHRLQRYFTKDEGNYRIRKDIREMVVFAPQNIIMDPPFTKLDLLCCRNMLIYLNAELQKKLIPLFYYALNPNGVLFLGSSESVGTFSELFESLDSKWKIFSRNEALLAQRSVVDLPSTLLTPRPTRHEAAPVARMRKESEIPEGAQRILLSEFAPPAVLIDEHGEILFINGRTGRFLEPAAGKSHMNIFSMAREGLRLDLSSAVRKASQTKTQQKLMGLRVKTNGGYSNVDVVVKPCVEPETLRGLLLVTFEEKKPVSPAEARRAKKHDGNVGARREVERELKYLKDTLQSTVEEMETSQEELKSTNEELQSTNEELQSSNEELTTSKEEMQSLNEELVTVNTELESKVEALSRANNDMKNLLNSIDVATVFLDSNLKVKRFTQQTTRLINLIPADIGRPITDIVSNLEYNNFIKDVQEVMQTLVSKEAIVQTKEGNWYQMRIMPYRTVDNVIDGAAITFTDCTKMKLLESTLRQKEVSSARLEELQTSALSITREWLLLLDPELHIIGASTEFVNAFGFKMEGIKGQPLFAVNNAAWNFPDMHRLLEDLLPARKFVADYPIVPSFQVGGKRKLTVSARIAEGDGQMHGITLAFKNAE
jgi:two-component system CheB/CheR fusion protein